MADRLLRHCLVNTWSQLKMNSCTTRCRHENIRAEAVDPKVPHNNIEWIST